MSIAYDPDRVASHLPVLLAMKDWPNLNYILEFGVGAHSTPLLREFDAAVQIVSYESDKQWYDDMDYASFSGPSHYLFLMSEAQALADCITSTTNPPDFDMAFVDGATREMRLPTAIVASQLCNLVVVHDTEKQCYIPIFQYFKALGWNEYTYKPENLPHTTMFTSNPVFIERLKAKL